MCGIITGARGRAGAAAMASYAALRAGAGLVTAAVPESILNTVAAIAPELMTEPLAETAKGSIALRNLEGERRPRAAGEEDSRRHWAGAGAGAGGAAVRVAAYRAMRRGDKPIPMVLDADCLNAIAQHKYALDGRGRTIVLTPHPGEMARLVGKIHRRGRSRPRGHRTRLRHRTSRHAGAQGLAHADRASRWTHRRQYDRQSRPGEGGQRRHPDRHHGGHARAVQGTTSRKRSRRRFICMVSQRISLSSSAMSTRCWRPRCVTYLDHAFRFRATQRDGITWLQGLPGDAGTPASR